MITVVVGKEIEKIKGDFESYLNGLNMVGEISYSQYSELYDEGTKQIQRAYELGKAELEKENTKLKDKLKNLASVAEVRLANWQKYEKGLKEAKDLIRNLLRVTYDEGWNYSLDVKVKAEDFLKECKEW